MYRNITVNNLIIYKYNRIKANFIFKYKNAKKKKKATAY